jgi:signal transduction histidine kinase/ligand-binding sensor domain-containing protein
MVIVLVAFFGSQSVPAQTAPAGAQSIVQESWTFKDGAPGQPTAFAQTADGYLWVGSPAGLFRFDGVRFEPFRSPFGDSLRSTNISALLAADDGLWVGYTFGGFSFLKKGKVRNFDENTSTVTGFARDKQGVTWASSNTRASGGGLWRFDGTSWQRLGAELIGPNLPVAHLGFDRDGIQWVLTGLRGPQAPTQLHYLAPGERRFRQVAGDLFVLGFTRDADGNVLTTRERSRSGLPPSVEMEAPMPAYPILRKDSVQIIDRANAIWVISKDSVVLRRAATEPLEEAIGKVSPANSEGIAINPVLGASLVDREGTVWLGATDAVHRFSHSPLVRLQLPAAPAPWFMLAPDDEGMVWISAGDGVGTSALYRVTQGKVDLQRPMAGVSSFVYRAPDKALWFGGEGGLWRMADGRLAKLELPKELAEGARFFTTMTHDGSGGFWIGGYGLHHLKDGAWTKYERRDLPVGTRRTCPETAVLSMFTDRASRVWLGCWKGGLTVFEGGQERNFGPKDGLAVGSVMAIHGRGSAMWIGGEFGLQQFDGGRFHAVRAIGDESLRGIVGIVETANGDLWLNGLGGIVHIRREEIVKSLGDATYQVTVERFDRRAGLPGPPSQLRHLPTAIEGTDGRLWFAVNGGVVWLDPTRASNPAPSPPVSIQSVSADDKVHETDQRPELPAGTSSIRISYAAVSLLHPEAIRFRYRLRGMEDEWHEAGHSTSVSYRNLAPGSYRFQVEASDANGAWSGKIASAELDILPAYYQTNWFRALCALMLMLLVWLGYQLRVRWLHRQFETTLETRVAERTRIARDLHDTLLQSFHGLLLRFQTASNLLPDRPAESKQVLASAIDQAAEAITEGRDAVQGLRTSATETNDLADSLRALAEELASESGNEASLHVEVQGAPRALHPIVRDEAFRIASEALRNAIRHAAAKQIEVELRYDERQLRIRVRDDGKGIDPEVLRAHVREGHYGLTGMRERAKLAGGKLTVWSGLDAGTEVELSIPGPRAYSGPSPARSWVAQKMFGQSEIGDQ